MWRRFASPSPLAFDEARRKGSIAFPELAESGELHGACFPRLKNGRLYLAELDEALLSGVEDSWRSVFDLFEANTDQRLMPMYWVFDPLFAASRLRAWATLGALDREALTDVNPFKQDRFRANERTRALLERGFDRVDEVPQLHVGGCLVNDPVSTWVRVDSADRWRLALHDPKLGRR